MMSIIKSAPANVAAFAAEGTITKDDFDNTVMPHVKKVVDEFEGLNYVLKLDTDLSNFTAGAWFQDALLGLKNLTKWNRAAIVTDKSRVQTFTEIFGKIMPGEFKAFDMEEIEQALIWASTGK